MRIISFAAGFAAAFVLLAAAPVLHPAAPVCAADSESETESLDWVPSDYQSAAAHYDQNILIHGAYLCVVSTEYKDPEAYAFCYHPDMFEEVSSVLYEAEEANHANFRVDVLKAIAPGYTEVYHSDNELDQLSSMYAFSIDDDLNISQVVLPGWFPKTFDNAVTFYNRYGKTRIADGLLCTVFHETFPEESSGKIEDQYALVYTADLLHCISSVRYCQGSDYFLVSLFEPAASGDAKVTHDVISENRLPYEYTFRIDENLSIKETDLCAWVPDCSQEFGVNMDADRPILTRGEYIVFLLQTTGGTGYSWKEAANDPAFAEEVASIDCSLLHIYSDEIRPSGGSIREARVYRVKQDGQFELRLDLMPPGRDREPADSVGGVMQIVDHASMVLLPGEARLTLLNAGTGKPIISPFDLGKSFYIDYLIGEEFTDPDEPEKWNPVQFMEIKTAVSKQPLGSLFANEEYQLWMTNDSMPQGYSCNAIYRNGVCNSGDTITVTRYTDDIADITITLQYSAQGDMNDDGAFNLADVVMLHRWLTGTLDSIPRYWKAADFNNDDRLDARDLTAMKRCLLKRDAAIAEGGLQLRVHTVYGGYGVAGQDLGHGEYDTDFFVLEGDTFYESYGGDWFQNQSDQGLMILRVEKIEEDTVTVSVLSSKDGSREEKTLNIGELYSGVPRSRHIVYDGINYSYDICFDRILTAPMTD